MKPEVRERIRAEMVPLVEAWRASGESRRVFATRQGISISKFDYWARQLGAARRRVRRAPRGFAAVKLVSPASESHAIEIVLPHGARVVIREGASAELVRHVVAAVRGAC